MADLITLTATGQYYVVYLLGAKVSQHTTEREAIQKCGELLLQYPTETITYRHEYAVNATMPVLLINKLVPRPDTTAPTPPVITATFFDASSVSLALTLPAGDTESGVASYRTEYKPTAGSIWVLDQAALSPASFPRIVPGLTLGVSYDFRARATDFAGNSGNYSVVTSATPTDVMPPTTPVITASAVSSSAISVALTTPSTDSGGSGVATYRLEYKRSVDSTWTLDSAALTAASFPRTISGLTASTAYDTRCRATDVSGNVGAFSATSSATTQSASVPVWTTVPTITFVQGAAANASVDQYVTPSGVAITKNGVALPTGVTYNSTLKRYEYNGTGPVGGTNGHILTADDAASDDWALLSTAPGVFVANRLDTSAIINAWRLPDAQQSQISLDTVLKPPGAAGSCKFAILNTNNESGGQVSVPFGANTFGNGQTLWASYRVYLQPQDAYQWWKQIPTPGQDASSKFDILSRDGNGPAPTGSSVPNETVVVNVYNSGLLDFYYQDGSSFVNVYDFVPTDASSGDIRGQISIDNGIPTLTGVNPDTGAAWSNYEQQRRRYGFLYSAAGNQLPPSTANYKKGLGDPWSGGFRPYHGEWITITRRIIIGNFGSFNNRVTLWAARQGQPYVKIADAQNIRLGAYNNYNGLNLVTFTTTRTSGGARITGRTNNITGATIHTCGPPGNDPGTIPAGDGVLEYNATTQRFRFRANGESFGVARGFSAANNILMLNVISASNSFVMIEVNPALLPTSGTVTDTVTIDNTSRGDTQRNYADAICSTQAINATAFNAAGQQVGPTGGYAPVG